MRLINKLAPLAVVVCGLLIGYVAASGGLTSTNVPISNGGESKTASSAPTVATFEDTSGLCPDDYCITPDAKTPN